MPKGTYARKQRVEKQKKATTNVEYSIESFHSLLGYLATLNTTMMANVDVSVAIHNTIQRLENIATKIQPILNSVSVPSNGTTTYSTTAILSGTSAKKRGPKPGFKRVQKDAKAEEVDVKAASGPETFPFAPAKQ